jgi:hypothetical protein
MEAKKATVQPGRVRVERGIYRQPNAGQRSATVANRSREETARLPVAAVVCGCLNVVSDQGC